MMARPGLREHPKFLRLVHLLGMPAPHVLGHLEFLWSVGYQCGNPKIGDQIDVELAAGWTGEKCVLCAALRAVGFLDQVGDVFFIHDLHENAPEYVKRRWRREKERKKRQRLTKSRTDRPLTGHDQPMVGHDQPKRDTEARLVVTPAPAPTPIKDPASRARGAHNAPTDRVQRFLFGRKYGVPVSTHEVAAMFDDLKRAGVTDAELDAAIDDPQRLRGELPIKFAERLLRAKENHERRTRSDFRASGASERGKMRGSGDYDHLPDLGQSPSPAPESAAGPG